MTMLKRYIVKVYDPKNYLGTLSASISTFQMSINGGLGEMTLNLPLPFSSFGQGNLVCLNNRYDVYCIDKDTSQDGRLIYSGFVNEYEAGIGEQSKVEVRLTGYWVKMARTILKEGTTIKLMTDTSSGLVDTGSATACEIEDVVKKIVDRFRAETLNPVVNYNTGSIETTNQDMTYTFLGSDYAKAIKSCRDFAPANWWFFVGADNILQFKAKPSTPTHYFVLGKHFKMLNIRHSMEGIINRYVFSNNDAIQKLYSDTDSSALYDDIWLIETDERVTVQGTADNKGNSKIAEYKDELVTITFDIFDNNFNDNGYDIESILPGDTCSLLNLDKDTQTSLDDNMIIVSVQYNKESVEIQVQTKREKIGEFIRELNDKTYGLEMLSLLDSYTT